MDQYGMSDADVWDAVKFVYEGVVETDSFITPAGAFPGDSFFGSLSFGATCAECHGNDGTNLNLGTQQNPEYVGTMADEDPWEFLHKMRFGQPGKPMPAAEHMLWSDVTLIDVGAYSQTLPVD
jgi:thiosulfate dehydrogenase